MSRTSLLLEKSISACMAAIEIYNKPDFKYREESFAVLMANAWELLLKAKIMKNNKNSFKSIQCNEPKKLKNGKQSGTQKNWLTTKSGSPRTISISQAIITLENEIDPTCRKNLEKLIEIRDCAVHFRHDDDGLPEVIFQLSAANLKNYCKLLAKWFNQDLTKFNFYIMPLNFRNQKAVFSESSNDGSAKKLINYLRNNPNGSKSDSDFDMFLQYELKFVSSKNPEATPVKLDNSSPFTVSFSDDQMREKYPWDHSELLKRLKERYSNFLQNSNFNKLKKEIQINQKYCHERKLDLKKKNSTSKFYYAPQCLDFFDKHYQRVKN